MNKIKFYIIFLIILFFISQPSNVISEENLNISLNDSSIRDENNTKVNCTTPIQVTKSLSSDYIWSFIQDSTGKYWIAFNPDRTGDSDIWVTNSDDCINWNYGYHVGGFANIGDWGPSLIQDNENIYWIAFNSYTENGFHVFITSSTDGIQWEEPTQITNWFEREGEPSLIQDQTNKFWMIFNNKSELNSNNNRSIYITNSDNGLDWSKPKEIIFSLFSINDAKLYQDNNGIFWLSYVLDYHDVWFTNSRDGMNWSEPIQITNDKDLEKAPFMMQEYNGIYWMIWNRFETGSGISWLQISYSLNCINWSAPMNISTGDYGAWYGNLIEDDNDEFWLTWSSKKSGNEDIWITKLLDLPSPKNTPPKILNISYFPNEIPNDNSTEIKFNIQVNDIDDNILDVTLDLSKIGGSNSQLLYDDETYGDIKANDNIFSFNTTIPYTISSGEKKIDLKVKDMTGAINSSEFEIQVKQRENVKPIPVLKVGNNKSYVNEDIVFDASDSYDLDGKISKYYFDFGDYNTTGWIKAPTVAYNYSQSGTYKAKLKVKDNLGTESKKNAEITIEVESINHPPIIENITIKPLEIGPNETCIITVKASDPDNDDMTYFYNATSGTISGSGSIITWQAPNNEGIYTIDIKVFDGYLYSKCWHINVTVKKINTPPKIIDIIVEPTEVEPGSLVTIKVNAIDENNDNLSYIYNATDGTIIGTGSLITWEASKFEGNYIITVQTYDGDMYSEPKKIEIIVKNKNTAPIIIEISANPEKIRPNGKSIIIVNATDSNVNDILNYKYEVTDGYIVGSGATVTWHAPDYEGTYIITIIIKDLAGEETTDVIEIIVQKQNKPNENNSIINSLSGTYMYIILILIILVLVLIYFIILKRQSKYQNKQNEEKPIEVEPIEIIEDDNG
jgi:hypothetical protein